MQVITPGQKDTHVLASGGSSILAVALDPFDELAFPHVPEARQEVACASGEQPVFPVVQRGGVAASKPALEFDRLQRADGQREEFFVHRPDRSPERDRLAPLLVRDGPVAALVRDLGEQTKTGEHGRRRELCLRHLSQGLHEVRDALLGQVVLLADDEQLVQQHV